MDDVVDRLRGLHDYVPGEDFQRAMEDGADEIERLRALLACAYQLAGYYDAPIRFLNAFALFDEYTKMSPDQIMDALLPITDQPSVVDDLGTVTKEQWDYLTADKGADQPSEVRHVCGMQGFWQEAYESGAVCPACEQSKRRNDG